MTPELETIYIDLCIEIIIFVFWIIVYEKYIQQIKINSTKIYDYKEFEFCYLKNIFSSLSLIRIGKFEVLYYGILCIGKYYYFELMFVEIWEIHTTNKTGFNNDLGL